MLNNKARDRLFIAMGLIALFLIVALQDGVFSGLWFVGCGILGWLNSFGAFQSLIWRVRGRRVSQGAIWLSVGAVIASVGVVLCGYGWLLLLTTAAFLLLNAVVLRFNALPIGASLSEP